MTIEATRTAEPNVGKILRRAARKANLISEYQQNLPGTKQSEGLDILTNVVDQLEAEGIFARSMSTVDISLTANQSDYDLGESVLGIHGRPIYYSAGEDPDSSDEQTYMRMVRREEYYRLGRSAQTSDHPTIGFEDRQTTPIVLKVWQTPSEAGTIRLQVHRLRADTTNTSSTMDFERYWNQYFVYAVAKEYAEEGGQSIQHVMFLGSEAERFKQMAKGRAHETPPRRFIMGHSTPWS